MEMDASGRSKRPHFMKTRSIASLSAVALLTAAFLNLRAETKGEGGEWQKWFADGTLNGGQIISGQATYKVEDGVLVGTTVDGSPNTFLAIGPFKDFELEFEVKVDDELNSGVQVRSHIAKEGDPVPEGSKSGKPNPPGRLFGPQCEIAVNGTAGDFYDEARRGTWWSILTKTESVRTDDAKAAFKKGGWNHYRIVVKGDHYQSFVNGVKTADFTPARRSPKATSASKCMASRRGTGPYSVRWRNVKFRETK
jgi:hypothetical protein